jgi:GNAT superfamily N-acetyltransferase
MTDLNISFLSSIEITPELERQIDNLDRLAFSGEEHTAESDSIAWATHEWMALGCLGDGTTPDALATQFCLLKREILVDGQPVWVAGVGGVATRPEWQRRGLASQLLRAAQAFMRDEIRVPFGLLICADERQHFYASCGWQSVAQTLNFTQDGRQRALKTCVMVLPLADQVWPAGEIDLRGLPW